MLAPAKLVFWWRYRVSQAVCQWLVIGVSFEKGHWDAPHFGRLCRPLNGSAMARRRGGAAVGFGPCLGVNVLSGMCTRVRVFVHEREWRVRLRICFLQYSRDISDCSGLSRSF